VFVNAAGNDYHLTSLSPAKDIGRLFYYSAAAPLVDIENTVRPQGPFPDAGAYEYTTPTGITENSAPPVRWQDLSPDDEIWLYDLSGRLMMNGNKRMLTDALKSLSKGQYLFAASDAVHKRVCHGWVIF